MISAKDAAAIVGRNLKDTEACLQAIEATMVQIEEASKRGETWILKKIPVKWIEKFEESLGDYEITHHPRTISWGHLVTEKSYVCKHKWLHAYEAAEIVGRNLKDTEACLQAIEATIKEIKAASENGIAFIYRHIQAEWVDVFRERLPDYKITLLSCTAPVNTYSIAWGHYVVEDSYDSKEQLLPAKEAAAIVNKVHAKDYKR